MLPVSLQRLVRAASLAAILVGLAAAPARAGVEDILAKAEARLDADDFAGARKLCEQAIKLAPSDARANTMLARIRFAYGDDASALAALKKAGGAGGRIAVMLEKILEGPFSAILGDDLTRFSGRTKAGHYFLQTDVGSSDRAALKKLPKSKKAPGFEEVGLLLEQIYGAYSRAFQGERDAGLVSRVFVFADRDHYVRWSKEVFDEDADDAAAYYDPNLRVLVVDADGKDKLSDFGRDSMFHEGFHQFLHFYLPSERSPYWFNEGVAEYFGPSRVLPGGRGVDVGVLPRSDGEHSSTLEMAQHTIDKWTPLKELMLLDAKGFMQPERALMHYSQSWAVVYFLCQSDAGKKSLVRYYDLLRAGKSQQEAFEAVFAKGVDKLEEQIKEYVKGLKPPPDGASTRGR